MLPKLHKRYSKAVLDEFRLPKAAKEQVVLGSIVNDYCGIGYLTSLHFIQCRDCVESVLKSKLYSTKAILTLSKDTMLSGGGVYA